MFYVLLYIFIGLLMWRFVTEPLLEEVDKEERFAQVTDREKRIQTFVKAILFVGWPLIVFLMISTLISEE